MNGTELRRRRKRLGLTQKELAAKLGVTENTVARWERDEVKMGEPAAILMRSITATSKGSKR